MKKVVLIGSIFSAVLLLFTCLPSVVGYREIIDNVPLQQPDTPWQPGVFILLFMAIMQAVGQAIAQGQWFPGMATGAILLYFILVWLIIFAQDDIEIPS